MILLIIACLTQAPPDTFDITTVGKDPSWQIAGRTATSHGAFVVRHRS